MKLRLLILSTFVGSIHFAYSHNEVIPDSTIRYCKDININHLNNEGNVIGKNKLDELFFGDFNARIEYLFNPPSNPAYGCRIYKTSNDTSVILEVKRVSNYQEINKQVDAEFPTENTDANVFLALSEAEQQRRLDYNEKVYEKRSQERLQLFKTVSMTIPLSDILADKLYDKTVGLLRTALPVGKSPYTIFGGESVTFRCVVDDDELWTLKYHVPEGEYKALSDLFRAMIADVEAGTFDEVKYLEALN